MSDSSGSQRRASSTWLRGDSSPTHRSAWPTSCCRGRVWAGRWSESFSAIDRNSSTEMSWSEYDHFPLYLPQTSCWNMHLLKCSTSILCPIILVLHYNSQTNIVHLLVKLKTWNMWRRLAQLVERVSHVQCHCPSLSHPVSCLVFSCTINKALHMPKTYLK